MWAALAPVLKVILQAILPLVWDKLNAPDTLEDARPSNDLRNALRDRLRNSGCYGSRG